MLLTKIYRLCQEAKATEPSAVNHTIYVDDDTFSELYFMTLIPFATIQVGGSKPENIDSLRYFGCTVMRASGRTNAATN